MKQKNISLAQMLIAACFIFNGNAFACPPAKGGDAAGGPPTDKPMAQGSQEAPRPPQTAAAPGGGSTSTTSSPSSGAPDMSGGGKPEFTNPPPQKAERAPAAEREYKMPPPAPYVPKQWSCSCSNIKKVCDKGFEFTSIADATAYAKRTCGDNCIPVCQGQPRR